VVEIRGDLAPRKWALAATGHLTAAFPMGLLFGLASGAWLGLADYVTREPEGSLANSMYLGAVIGSVPFVAVWLLASLMAGGIMTMLYPRWQNVRSRSLRLVEAASVFSLIYLIALSVFALVFVAPMNGYIAAIGSAVGGATAWVVGWLHARYLTFGLIENAKV
jgi:hypothetical protein